MAAEFKGMFVALVTPFRDGQVDYPTLGKLVDFHLQAGTDGLVPCGTTGESPTLSHDEHDKVIERVIQQAAGKIPVMAGTGSNSTAEAIRLTRHAEKAGADAALLVSPYYNKPTQQGLYEHFKAIAESTALPLILYNIPGRCCVEIQPETIARLAEIKNIVGVKHATGTMDPASALFVLCRDKNFQVISGDDSMTLPLMSIGAVGVISVIGNLIPKDTKAMTDAALAGDFATAMRWHHKLFALARGMLALETNPIPIKTAMAIKGMLAEEFRLPMSKISPANKTKLQQMLTDYGL